MSDRKLKIPVELTPYNALTLLSFLWEFIPDKSSVPYNLTALKEAIDEYSDQIFLNITDEQFEDYKKENEINQMIGKSPKARNKK